MDVLLQITGRNINLFTKSANYLMGEKGLVTGSAPLDRVVLRIEGFGSLPSSGHPCYLRIAQAVMVIHIQDTEAYLPISAIQKRNGKGLTALM